MTDDGGADLARRDEVLQLLYWLEGEGFAGTATPAGLARFLAYPEPDVAAILSHLTTRGDVACKGSDGEYCLTETGRREAARRFADEFAPMLNQGHGECNDPACECHRDPHAAAECHARPRHE